MLTPAALLAALRNSLSDHEPRCGRRHRGRDAAAPVRRARVPEPALAGGADARNRHDDARGEYPADRSRSTPGDDEDDDIEADLGSDWFELFAEPPLPGAASTDAG